MSVRKCVRCNALTNAKKRCKRQTCKYGPYCFQHTRSIEGVEIKKSKLPGAGLGLFATRKFKKGSRVTTYGGEVISQAESDRRDSGYALTIGRGRVLDGRATSSGNGRYVNSCRRSNRKHCSSNNAQLPVLQRRNGRVKGTLRVSRTILPGSEIYASYGPNYWGDDRKVKAAKKARARKARAKRR